MSQVCTDLQTWIWRS